MNIVIIFYKLMERSDFHQSSIINRQSISQINRDFHFVATGLAELGGFYSNDT
jgi:hypothetical protein